MRPIAHMAVVALAAAASVTVASGPAAADSRKAKQHAERGRALTDLGKWADAVAAYEAAYVEKRDPAYLYNIADCQRQLGNKAEAVRVFRNYLRDAPKARNRAEVERLVAELEGAPAAETPTRDRAAPPPPPGPASPPLAPAPAPAPMPRGPVPPAPAAAPGGGASPPASPAGAAGRPGEGQDPDLEAAKAEFESGVTLYLKEQYDAAAGKYLAAFDRKPFPAFIFNAAVAYEKGKRLELAKTYYEKYLEREPDAKDAPEVRSRIEALNKMLTAGGGGGVMLPAIQTKGLVVIESKPPGANLYFGDKKSGLAGRTPWQGSLESKPVKVIVESQGFKPEERELSPRSDKLLDVYIALSQEHYLGWIEITSNVVGADVFIDRKDIGAMGRTPFTGHLKPGRHTIHLSKAGHVPVEKQLEVLPGTATQHSVLLERVAYGWINVVGRHMRGAKLSIDGKFACDTPCRHEAAPGRHQVKIERPLMEPFSAEVDVDRSTDSNVEVQFSPKPSRARGWTAGVFSALFLGGGIVVGNMGRNDRNAIENDIKEGKDVNTADPRVDAGKIKYYVADALFGASLITAVMSVVGFLSSGEPSTGMVEQKAVGLAPAAGPDGAGLRAWWRF